MREGTGAINIQRVRTKRTEENAPRARREAANGERTNDYASQKPNGVTAKYGKQASRNAGVRSSQVTRQVVKMRWQSSRRACVTRAFVHGVYVEPTLLASWLRTVTNGYVYDVKEQVAHRSGIVVRRTAEKYDNER